MTEYIIITLKAPQINFDLLTALLLDIGCDSFSEEPNQLIAYIEESVFDQNKLKNILQTIKEQSIHLEYQVAKLENKNWNAEWENNFEPVKVKNECIVRASFHPIDKQYTYDIIINPKMSFGTGHHETTHMMLEHLLDIEVENKIVMDAGAGTGILSILASMKKAKAVTAFDIEDWAYNNAIENIKLNNCNQITVLQGTINTLNLPFNKYDIILANINKNVLLEEISVYYKFLNHRGILILSGFFENDISDLNTVAQASNLLLEKTNVKNNWSSIIYKKN
ncbi:MAG: 50S ribosomal protein L11 methyltransferase [Cytophagales bacterium]|nr:MAG: 50S ribosomal protein L11 methyltransferase [Cytophagales bacterium]